MVARSLARTPLPWPFRLLGWFLLGTVALVIIGGVAVIGAESYYELTRTKPADVEAIIEERLPRGASTDQVFMFLDSRGIEHGPVGPADLEDSALLDYGVVAETMTIEAIVRNDGYSLSLVDIEITFILDERGLFKDYVVRQVGR
jgi:hypothetical protein